MVSGLAGVHQKCEASPCTIMRHFHAQSPRQRRICCLRQAYNGLMKLNELVDVDGCFQQQRMWHWKGLTVSSYWVSILRHIQVVFPRQHPFLANVWAPGMQWLIIQGAIDILCKQVSKSKWRFVVHCGPTSQALRVMNFSWKSFTLANQNGY